MHRGFVKIHRKITSWEWYADTNTFRVFLHLLLKANYKTTSYKGHTINKGSVVVGYPSLADNLNLTIQNVRTVIKRLKSTGEITVKVTAKFSIVILINYGLYHDDGEPTNSQSNSLANSQLTVNQQSTNSQLTTSKEVKKEKKQYSVEFEEFWKLYPKKGGSKKNAHRIYLRITTKDKVEHSKIISGLRGYVRFLQNRKTEQKS